LQIITAYPRHVLDDDRADVSGFDLGYQPFPAGALEVWGVIKILSGI
jgi:hypothetical protein